MGIALMRIALFVLAMPSLLGCTTTPIGVDFSRPGLTTFALGQTTRSDILNKYGPPREQKTYSSKLPGSSPSEAAEIGEASTFNYLFLPSRSLVPPASAGVLARKQLDFYFWNDRLVGYRFFSSVPSDSTDFDETRLAKITKGKTTTSEAISLLGVPSGMGIYPLMREKNQHYVSYNYAEWDTDKATYRLKQAWLKVDTQEVVIDHQFQSETKPYNSKSPNVVPIPIPIPVHR